MSSYGYRMFWRKQASNHHCGGKSLQVSIGKYQAKLALSRIASVVETILTNRWALMGTSVASIKSRFKWERIESGEYCFTAKEIQPQLSIAGGGAVMVVNSSEVPRKKRSRLGTLIKWSLLWSSPILASTNEPIGLVPGRRTITFQNIERDMYSRRSSLPS